MTQEEKIEKAKELINELKELELSEDELTQIAGGATVNSQITDAVTQANKSN